MRAKPWLAKTMFVYLKTLLTWFLDNKCTMYIAENMIRREFCLLTILNIILFHWHTFVDDICLTFFNFQKETR